MRILLRFLFSAVGLLVASYLVPGIRHGAFMDLVAVAVLLGALNATLGGLLKFLALVPVVLSFGCLSLLINGLVFWLAGTLSSSLGLGFSVSGFWAGFFGAFITSLTAGILELILIGRDRGDGDFPRGPRRIKIVH